jgi:glycosyltransferase involved in cell wall biosynthesis
MAEPGLVSIVVVAYQNWPDLELAIESCLSQSYRSVEVIVVDNASTDATRVEVPRRYGVRLRYLRERNRGDGGGYNSGIAAARGEYVQLLDGDDFLAPDKVAKQVAAFETNPDADIVYGDVRQFQLRAGAPTWVDWDTGEQGDMLLALVAPDRNHAGIMAQCALFRRRTLDRVGRFDESLYVVDYDYWLRAAWLDCRFLYCPGSIAFYQSRPGQMSADLGAMMDGIAAVWRKALTYVDREPYRGILARRLAQRELYLALATAPNRAAALRGLARVRALDSSAVPPTALALAYVLAALPARRTVMRSRALASARALLQRRFGLA